MYQNEVLNEIVSKYRENKLAHAYLVETNNIEKATKDILELVKILNCPNDYIDNCNKCNLCNLINRNNLPSLKIIEPDGTSIKKNQVETLKNNFGTKPIYSRFNIYIIKNAEKLNSSSANSMLKFVEEPNEGILGFFITSNKDVIIDTIKSRCQSLILNYTANGIIESLNIDKETYESYLPIIKEYLTKINNNSLINNKTAILNTFSERKDLENILKIILEIYYNNLMNLLGKNYDSEIIKIYSLNLSVSKITNCLKIIATTLHNIGYNVNMELLLDKFVIEMRGNNG